MALFNDGAINGIEELATYDSSLVETSTAEGIDVGVKIGQAQDAIGTELLTFLLSNEPIAPNNGGPRFRSRGRHGISDVVVTGELKRWHAFLALREVYQDANGRQSNDRYQRKWQEYGTLARAAKVECLDIGIGLAADPIPRAQPPVVSIVQGDGPAATLYFAVTLVDAAGQESVASDAVMINVPVSMQALVRLSATPDNTRGWNVYAGSDPRSLMEQNETVLDQSGVWTQPALLSFGRAPGDGQRATSWVAQHRVIRRG